MIGSTFSGSSPWERDQRRQTRLAAAMLSVRVPSMSKRNAAIRRPGNRSCIAEQCFEPVVHVSLDMAVKQTQARLVGQEVDARPAVQGNHYSVFHDATGGLPVHVDELEEMTMQMNRMRVIRSIAEVEPIALTLLQNELPLVGVGLAVDGPQIEGARASRNLFEHHVDDMWRLLVGGARAHLSG